jgi:hypothetical protein
VIKRVVVLCLLIVAFQPLGSPALAQRRPGWLDLPHVHSVYSLQRRDRALEAAILDTLPGYREELDRLRDYNPETAQIYKVRYFYNHVDLNDDGRPEALVWLHSPFVGGTSGYRAQIYLRTNRDYRLLCQIEPIWNPIVVTRRRTNGWRTLVTKVVGGGIQPGYWTEIRFDGDLYGGGWSGAKVSRTRVRGTAYVADNWWTSFRGITLEPAR